MHAVYEKSALRDCTVSFTIYKHTIRVCGTIVKKQSVTGFDRTTIGFATKGFGTTAVGFATNGFGRTAVGFATKGFGRTAVGIATKGFARTAANALLEYCDPQ